MADAFRGLTIRLGADTRPLTSAIDSIKHSAGQAQTQLKAMQKALNIDPTNITAMQARLDAVGDKTRLAARAADTLRTALNQAQNETVSLRRNGLTMTTTLKNAAAETKDIAAATGRARNEYNHINKELAHIYEAAAKVKAAQDGMSFEKALKSVQKMARNMGTFSTDALKAKETVERLVMTATADKSTGLAERFGLGDATSLEGVKSQLSGMVDKMHKLRSEHSALQTQLESFNKIQAYKDAQIQLVSYESELRQAAMEAARFKAEMYSVGADSGIAKAVEDVKRLDAAVEKSVSEAREMKSVYETLPHSIEAARAKAVSAASAEEALNAKMRALKTVMKELESSKAFDKIAAQSGNTRLALDKAVEKVAEFNSKVKVAEERVSALEAELREANNIEFIGPTRDVGKLNAELSEAKERLVAVREAALGADAALDKAASAHRWRESNNEYMKAGAQLKQLKAQAGVMRSMANAGKGLREFGFGWYSSVTPAILIAGRYAIQAANDIDSAYRDMRKTVNGTEEDFEHLRDAALEFSQTHVTSADTILEIEAMGGQLGIAVGDLEAFATTVSNLDIATNMEADDIAEKLGKMASVMGINVDEYDNFGDALVRLGNNLPVMEGDIMTLTTRFMGMGKVVGMQPHEMLAWAAAASATGQKAEAAGSSMQRFISKMETAVVNQGEMLDIYAEVAGMEPPDFAALFNEDASQAMYKFIEGLGEMQKNGESVNQMLGKLEIGNVRDKQLLEGLANQMANAAEGGSVLAQALGMASTAWNGEEWVALDGSIEYAGDAAREAAKKSEGFSGELQKMKNNAMQLAQEFSNGALPIIKTLGEMFLDLTQWVKDLPSGMNTAVVAIAGLAALVGPAAIAVGTLLQSFERMGTAASKITGKLSTAAAKIDAAGKKSGAASTSVGKLSKAMAFMSNPGAALGITLAVAAVAALAAAVADARKKTENFKKATEGLVDAAFSMPTRMEIAAGSFTAVATESYNAYKHVSEFNEVADKAAERGAALGDTISEKINGGLADAQLIQYYSDKILELSNNFDGSEESLRQLNDFIGRYNELTGGNLSVTDNLTGKLSEQNEVLELNTQKYKENAYAKALADASAELVKEQATLNVEMAKTNEAYSEGVRVRDEMYQADKELIDYYNEHMGWGDYEPTADEKARLEAYQEQSYAVKELGNDMNQLQEQSKAVDKALTNVDAQQRMATSSADEYQKKVDALKSTTEDYRNALTTIGDVPFDEYAASLGTDADGLAQKFRDAGVSAEELAQVGSDAFANLMEAAGGDLANLRNAIDLLNAAGIDPVTMTVTEEGIEDVETGLWQLDLAGGTISQGDYILKVTADGIVDVTAQAQEAVDTVEGGAEGEATLTSNADEVQEDVEDTYDTVRDAPDGNVTITADASAAYSTIETLKQTLANLTSSPYTVTINAQNNVPGNAAGGVSGRAISAIPRNAAGGMNGIVTRATMTNVGLVGEAGDEAVFHMRHAGGAIIPLSNRQHVRPFARAVASEMGGNRSSVNNVSVYLQYDASTDAMDLARDLARNLDDLMNVEG